MPSAKLDVCIRDGRGHGVEAAWQEAAESWVFGL